LQKTISDELTLRKGYFSSCYENTLATICDIITDQKIWASIDETMDLVCLNVVNVIVGTLQPQNPSNMYVIHTEYLDKLIIIQYSNYSIKLFIFCGEMV